MVRFEIGQYDLGDVKALRRALGRRAPLRRAASWGLRLLLLAAGLPFGLVVVFFWGTYLASGPAAALRPGSNDLAVAVVCHALFLLALLPALGCGPLTVRSLLRARNRLTPLAVTLEGEALSLEMPRWTDSLPYSSVEAVFRVRGRWVFFLKNQRVLLLPERCLTRGGAYSLEDFLQGRGLTVTCLGGGNDGI